MAYIVRIATINQYSRQTLFITECINQLINLAFNSDQSNRCANLTKVGLLKPLAWPTFFPNYHCTTNLQFLSFSMGINKTKVITVPGAGNGLASVPDLEAGDLIIEIANPYIIVVEKASLDKVCSKCLLKTDKLKRCARCKVAQYCSTNCQSTAWKSVHKLECSAMAEMPSIPPTPVRALSMTSLPVLFLSYNVTKF